MPPRRRPLWSRVLDLLSPQQLVTLMLAFAGLMGVQRDAGQRIAAAKTEVRNEARRTRGALRATVDSLRTTADSLAGQINALRGSNARLRRRVAALERRAPRVVELHYEHAARPTGLAEGPPEPDEDEDMEEPAPLPEAKRGILGRLWRGITSPLRGGH